MLIEFRFKNFRSFKSEQTLTLTATTDKQLQNANTFQTEQKLLRLLRTCVVYGANASGKSNLIQAFIAARRFILESATKNNSDSINYFTPFILDATSKESPSEFETHFIHRHIRYQYGFIVNRKRVLSEWLISYPKGYPQKVFERKWVEGSTSYDWNFGSRFKGERHKLSELTRPNALYLSVGANLNHPDLMQVQAWFKRYFRIVDSGDLSRTVRVLQRDEGLKSAVTALLQFADLGIESIQAVEVPADKIEFPKDFPEELKNYIKPRAQPMTEIHTWHKNPEGGEPIKFELAQESAGTQKFFGFLGPCLNALKYGRTICIDELDASLHPLLARKLISLFHDPMLNIRGAQLILTTHDTTLLDQTIFRRDQIWLTERDPNSSSHIYSLLTYKPRKGEALQRGYLSGRYGGIPFFETQPDLAAWIRNNEPDDERAPAE